MREFMDYVHSAFYEATGWDRDNSYAALNTIPDALLDFSTPRGLRLSLSSLASSNFATSYQLGSVGVVDGSISYLWSSEPLAALLTPRSEDVPLPTLLRSYRPLRPLSRRDGGGGADGAAAAAAGPVLAPGDRPDSSLLYGRLYLPQSLLEALVVRRVSPTTQVQFSAVSGAHLRNGGTAVGLVQYDVGRYAWEGLASSDGGLLGLRGVYNSGGDVDDYDAAVAAEAAAAAGAGASTDSSGSGSGSAVKSKKGANVPDKERIYGRFSTGAEVYYGTLNKSGGISVGTRFATLPAYRGTPLSATLTLNPLMGNINANYAVMAGRHCSLATRMEFNVFSYESAWAIGMELWRKPFVRALEDEDLFGVGTRSFQAKMEWRLDEPAVVKPPATKAKEQGTDSDAGAGDGDSEEYAGVLKARLDQNMNIGVLWEGRIKSLLFSLGTGIDLRRLDRPFRTLGLEISFSS